MRDRSTLAAFLLSALLAGGNGVAVRFSNHKLAPLWGATARFAIATAVLFAVVAVPRVKLPRGRAPVGSVAYGIPAFALTCCISYIGLVQVAAGSAKITLALVPLLTCPL